MCPLTRMLLFCDDQAKQAADEGKAPATEENADAKSKIQKAELSLEASLQKLEHQLEIDIHVRIYVLCEYMCQDL